MTRPYDIPTAISGWTRSVRGHQKQAVYSLIALLNVWIVIKLMIIVSNIIYILDILTCCRTPLLNVASDGLRLMNVFQMWTFFQMS